MGPKCCDRYNSDLCAEKDMCRRQYIVDQNVAVDILMGDVYFSAILVSISGFVLISVAAFRSTGKAKASPYNPEVRECDPKLLEAIKALTTAL
jgi:hypothetical protein